MDIMELGAIGEMVGGVAVLATLIYLAVQVRQGNKTERAQAHRSWTREMNHAFFSPLQEPEFANMVRRAGEDFASLSGDEQLAVSAFWAAIISLGAGEDPRGDPS